MITRSPEVCLNEKRRADVRAHRRNGIDYVEVSEDQRTLTVYFLRKAPERIVKENVQIEGGRRIREIRVIEIRLAPLDDSPQGDCLQVMVDKPGDFSTYKLRLVNLDDQGQPTDQPLTGFDPRYAQAAFSFKAGLASDVDCQPQSVCLPTDLSDPDINYLAKDYGSFRQLILDRLALTMPDWQEQHVPDVGIALVEVLAYAGDYLSYYQDAVATEAYLNTARQRISVRRHVRLVGYAIHEGCNARTWVFINTNNADVADPPLDPTAINFVASVQHPLARAGAVLAPGDLPGTPGIDYEVFEPAIAAPISLYQAHDQISFYTWGNQLCCLAAGATSATLRDYSDPTAPGRILHLKVGDFLLFEEAPGSNADRNRRHVVRLTKVEPSMDTLYEYPVVEIEWAAQDALPFPLCLSTIGAAPECAYLEDRTVVRGNLILADHGSRISNEALGVVPCASTPPTCEAIGRPADIQVSAAKFRPTLKGAPLTFSQPISRSHPAAGILIQDPHLAMPQIWLSSIPPAPDGTGPLFTFEDLRNPANMLSKLAHASKESPDHLSRHFSVKTLGMLRKFDASTSPPKALTTALLDELYALVRHWTPKQDLLSSQGQDFDYVVEIDNDGFAHLRFGDGDCGREPEAGEAFEATYRVGNGPAGNVGAETITRAVVSRAPGGATLSPRNPVAAQGGLAPQPIDEVKLFAPGAFQNQLARAIIPDDYATLAERNPKVQRAAADLRWTGTRYEVHVAIDPLGTEEVDPKLLEEIEGYLYPYRRVGQELVVAPPQYVPLDIAITVYILPDYFRVHVKSALLDVFSNRVLADGTRGFFHPDNLSFGDSIYLSQLISAAQGVTGVQSVIATRLERLFVGPNHEVENGVLPMGPLEVPRLDNDPGLPENGRFLLNLRGGR